MIFEKQVINIYKSMICTRCDDTETVFYYSADDFEGLVCESYKFTSSQGHTLQGYIYNYDNFREGRLVVFDHGFGGGHRAYMKEIELLCRHGFQVFSYDHTGCMESGGESAGGLSQSLCDLNDCLTTIKADSRFSDVDISVMGHSWGGFSTLNITAFHPDVSHIVVLSGFVSVPEIIKTFFPGPLKAYHKAIYDLEKQSNPVFSKYNAVDTLSDSDVKALLIYSDNDKLVRKVHYDILKNGLDAKENINLVLVNGKSHNPNYTENAIKLLVEFSSARTKFLKNKNATQEDRQKFVKSFDWDAITEQDENVWNTIFEHLDK